MQDKQDIVFTVTVTEEDWDLRLRGWRCPALKIPGATVESVFVSGDHVDSSQYEVKYDLDIIRWALPKHPPQATIQVKLTKKLYTEDLSLKWKKLAIIFPLVATIFATSITGFLSYRANRRAASTDNSNTISLHATCGEKIKITHPVDNQTVPIPLEVTGTYQNLTQEQEIYVLVYSTAVGRYYPQLNPVMKLPDNTWSSDVLVGLDRDVGGKFVIYAVLANKEARDHLDAYINQVKDSNDSQGLKRLPNGAEKCSFVRIQRG